MAFRYDKGSLQPARRLDDGRLRVDGYLSRTGVLTYRNADGSTRKEYRPPDEVFHADALASFALVPVTDDHPTEPVTADNAKRYAVGSVGENIHSDGIYVAAALVINDATTIRKVERGKVQVSCGYRCDLDPTPGVSPDGEPYDVIQRNIRGNHVAIVDQGRAGPAVRIRLDDAFNVTKEDILVMDELEKAKAALAEAMASLVSERARADKAEGALAAERARADKAEQLHKDATDTLGAKIQARVALVTEAAPVLEDEDLSTKSDREIKIAVIQKLDGVAIPADRSDDYVDGHYSSVISRSHKADRSLGALRMVAESKKDETLTAEEAALAKLNKDVSNRWKEGN